MAPIDIAQLRWDDEPINEAVVQVFMEKMRKSEPIGSPVVWEQPNGRFLVVDGRNRIEAAKRLGETAISCYVITSEFDEQKFQELRRSMNERRSNN